MPHPSAYCLLFFVSHINLTFSSIIKIYLSFVTVAMSSLYHLLLTAGVKRQRETSNTVTTTVAFSRPGIYVAT